MLQDDEHGDDRHDGTAAAEAPARKARAPRAASRRGGAASAIAADAADPAPATVPAPAPYKTRDLVDRVAKVSGMKRRAAKPLVETVLAELGAVLGEGRPMALRPLGKITVARTREAGGGQVLVCRIRQRGKKPDEALAEGAEGS